MIFQETEQGDDIKHLLVTMHGEYSRFFLIKLCPFFQILLVVFALGVPSAQAYNLDAHPTLADIAVLANGGFESARTELESELARFYNPRDQKKVPPGECFCICGVARSLALVRASVA